MVVTESQQVIDRQYMARTLQLARRGRYTTSPNPQVGCLIVNNGAVVGEGWHQYAGEGHAEVNALADAGAAARGGTAYVSLEPCSHHGRTPPCCEALVKAGIARVVGAMEDPNPLVAGQGYSYLKEQGLQVSCGLLETEAQQVLLSYSLRMREQRPQLILKMAVSLDGRSAMASGESQWITGPESRLKVQQLRASSCAIVTGIGTVLEDDCALTVRVDDWAAPYLGRQVRQPLRVVLDSGLRLPADARILQQAGTTVVAYSHASEARQQALDAAGAVLYRCPAAKDGLDLAALFRWLATEYQCHRVMIEAGARLAGSCLQQGFVDELHIFQAPVLLGSSARAMALMPVDKMADASRFALLDQRSLGHDQYLRLQPLAG